MKRSPSKSNRLLWPVILPLYTVALICLLSACKSVKPVVTAQLNDHTENHSLSQRDSMVIRDSVVIRYVIGQNASSDCLHGEELCPSNPVAVRVDTVFRDRWRTEYRDRMTQTADSTDRKDSQTTQLPPERYIPPWAWYTLAACILMAVILIIRIILRFYLRR